MMILIVIVTIDTDKRYFCFMQVYTQYLSSCKFNTEFNPDGVIRFSQKEAQNLGNWAASTLGEEHNRMPEPLLVNINYNICHDNQNS